MTKANVKKSGGSTGTAAAPDRKRDKAKAPASFAYKFAALSMVRRLFMLFQLNILFLVLAFIGLLVIAEQNVGEAYRDWQLTGTAKAGRCSIGVENGADGVKIPGFISGRFAEESLQGTRKLALGAAPEAGSKLAGLTYHAYIQQEDIYVHIVYAVGAHVAMAAGALPAILIIQLVIWLAGFFADLRSAQALLQPLREMTLSARDLQKQTPPVEYRRPQQNLNDLTGEINQMGPRHDAKLRVNDIELEGLADAINAMLDRVHESYRQQSQFVSDASHELRTPLAVIEGYANMLDRWGKHDEKTLQESVEAIKSESAHMKALVEQLLFLARGDNDTMVFDWQRLDIQKLAEEVCRGAQLVDQGHDWSFTAASDASAASDSSADLADSADSADLADPADSACPADRAGPASLKDPAGPAVDVYGDESLLKQTLRILTDNATRYAPAGTKIAVMVTAQANSVRISVQDQGIGIAPEDIPRIFDRFFRSETSRARVAGGTGLGLAIAKWITEKHGGHMEVLSREGIGTRVTVELPRVSV